MFKKYTIIALGALMLGGQASGMGSWARKLWAPSAVAAASVYTSKTTLCEEKPGCWQWFKAKMGWTQVKPKTGISEEILDLYGRMERSVYKKDLFSGKALIGGNLVIDPTHGSIEGSPDLVIRINASREELVRPSANVEATGYVSKTGYDSDKYSKIREQELNELLKLRTSLLLAVEKARTKKQQEMIDSEVVQGDSYFGPGNDGLTGVVRADGTILYSPITPQERKIRERLSEVILDSWTKCFAPEFFGKDKSRGSMRCFRSGKPLSMEPFFSDGLISYDAPLKEPR